MNRFIICLVLLLGASGLSAQNTDLHFIEAADLTILGKVFPHTPKPYERMDFERFGGWEKSNVNLLEMSSGIMISFTGMPLASAMSIQSCNDVETDGAKQRGDRHGKEDEEDA